ncbi:YusG family protein [Desertibacillus haloalkaliphilus]|uniref:YusG family protein n=1 Tax=Desertibacillus haloalkaliphilus TaxID=1328930 RepID=UPI001C275C44|nr:YusG family protein [Desertibacillus haloalkaliphilus]MBU8906620.1 YusG family protein [Desertibacillus haloalkaliphilus]
MDKQQLQKVDITGKVEGKFEHGKMNLYVDKAKVGEIVMTNQGNMYEMSEGFEFDHNKVFRYEKPAGQKEKSYVEGCDMGWC